MANNYRNSDFAPYAYHTSDYGKSWERVADNDKVFGYALCILQDPVEPNLIFLGTEHGLWVSIDKGKNWTRWTHGFPAVSTMDLDLQEREADLVIGTFGRSVYILDDIRPLRKIASTGGLVLENPLSLFNPADAVIVNGMEAASGSHFPADAIFNGENKPSGAIIKVFLKLSKEIKKESVSRGERRSRGKSESVPENSGEKNTVEKKSNADSLKINILNKEGKVVKTITQKADSGLNIITWRFDEGEMKMPTRGSQASGRRGFSGRSRGNKTALPGTYKILAQFNEYKDSTILNVLPDPRIPIPLEALIAQREMIDKLTAEVEVLYNGTQRLIESKNIAAKVSANIRDLDGENIKVLQKAVKAVQDSINMVQDYIFGKENPDAQGITSRSETTVNSKVSETIRYISSRPGMPTTTEERLVVQSQNLIKDCAAKINSFYENVWPAFRKKVENTEVKIFKDYQPLTF